MLSVNRGIALAIGSCVLSGAARADVIFDSWQPPPTHSGTIWIMTDLLETSASVERPDGEENEAQVGAALALAGAARFVTSIEIPATVFGGSIAADFTLSLFTDAGGMPGAPLWSGVEHFGPASSVRTLTFRPNLLLPDTLFYALTYDNISPPLHSFGAFLARVPPTLGSNGQLMTQDSTTLAWTPSPFTTPVDSIEMRIAAVPAPGCLMLMMPICFRPRRSSARAFRPGPASTP